MGVSEGEAAPGTGSPPARAGPYDNDLAYAPAEDWLGPPQVTEQEAVEHLVRRYLGTFGPASWRHEAGRIELEPFGRLDDAERRALSEEADRLADLHAS